MEAKQDMATPPGTVMQEGTVTVAIHQAVVMDTEHHSMAATTMVTVTTDNHMAIVTVMATVANKNTTVDKRAMDMVATEDTMQVNRVTMVTSSNRVAMRKVTSQATIEALQYLLVFL